MKKRKKKSFGDILMDVIISTILIAFSFICLYPVWFVLMASVSSSSAVTMSSGILFWPQNFGLKAYELVFENKLFVSGFINSIKLELYSLPINIALTLMLGYFFACSGMMLKKPITTLLMFSMYFGGGMIPAYLNIRDLGLYNTIWALILPGAVSIYNSIICSRAIKGVPDSLKESAYLDGANDLQIIFKVILPLIKPTLAVLTMYYGVGHWSAWFGASIYLRDNSKLPIQNVLRSVLLWDQSTGVEAQFVDDYAETIKYAAVVIATVPILCIYPFLQKHFTKGVLVGAVKG